MRAETLQAELHKRPFVPFRIVMNDGKEYDILHPDLVWVTAGGAMVGFPRWQVGEPSPKPPEPIRPPERFDHISLGLISRLECIDPPAQAPAPEQGDGQGE
jgi:hypothetical protein